MRRCSVTAHLMSSSVTMKALHRGWAVLSHTPGFFSTAADSWPVIGAALVCRALAIADRRVLSVQPGPTPEGHNQQRNYEEENQTVRTIHSIFIDYVQQISVKYPEGLSAAPLFSPAPRRCHRHSDRWASSPKIAAEENIFYQLQELYQKCNYVLLVYKHKVQFAQFWICWKC